MDNRKNNDCSSGGNITLTVAWTLGLAIAAITPLTSRFITEVFAGISVVLLFICIKVPRYGLQNACIVGIVCWSASLFSPFDFALRRSAGMELRPVSVVHTYHSGNERRRALATGSREGVDFIIYRGPSLFILVRRALLLR